MSVNCPGFQATNLGKAWEVGRVGGYAMIQI